jgi:hypothetical protein
MRAIIFPANGEPYDVEWETVKYEELKKLVGGFVELVALGPDSTMVCNEDGISLGLPRNRSATLLYFPDGGESMRRGIERQRITAAEQGLGFEVLGGEKYLSDPYIAGDVIVFPVSKRRLDDMLIFS